MSPGKSDFDRTLEAWRAIEDAIRVVGSSIDRLAVVGSNRAIIHVVEVQTGNKEVVMPPVDHMPDFTLPSSSVRAVLAVVGPKKADGSYATSPTWSTSDETALPLEAIPDSVITDDAGVEVPVYKTYANTPLTPAEGQTAGGVVTWKAVGMADVDIKVIYGDPAFGHAAITAGEAAEAVADTATVLAAGTVGVAYSASVAGSTPETYAVTGGALPDGCPMDSAGTISGTPSTAGTFPFASTGTAPDGTTTTKSYTITIS